MPELRAAGDPSFVRGADLEVSLAHVRSVADPGPVAARLESLIAGHPDALIRTCRPGHLTGSAFVVDATATQGLLLHHAKLRKWLQPGGHADGEADLSAVALREATEETGIEGLRVAVPAIDLDIHEVRPPSESPHEHYDVRFLVLAPPGAVELLNHESTGSRWLTEPDLERERVALSLDAGTLRLAARAFELARQIGN